jgi:hypothetical protein
LEGKLSTDEKVIEFSFLDVAGSTRGGYLKDMVITLIDADHHRVEITFVMPDGKPIPLRGDFQRTGPTANLQNRAQFDLFTFNSEYPHGRKLLSVRIGELQQTGRRV